MDSEEDFGQTLKRLFHELVEARNACPFHKDKRVYQADIELCLETFTDWQNVQSL